MAAEEPTGIPEPGGTEPHWHEPVSSAIDAAAEKHRRWQEGESAVTHIGAAPYERRRHWPKAVLGVAILLLLLVGAYFLGFQRAQAPLAKKQQAAQNKAQRQLASTTAATKHYTSPGYSLSFDYPDNWIVSDTTAKLTVTSPEFEMVNSSGNHTTGHVVISIQNQQTSLPGYPSGGASASLASDTLTYKAPSSVQRASSNLSYLGYGGVNGIDALYLTGDNGYQMGQAVSLTDILLGNPLVGVSFVDCAKSYCTGGSVSPITISAGSWKSASYKTPVMNILQSLVFN